MLKFLFRFAQKKLNLIALFSLATVLFLVHSYTVFHRYLKFETVETRKFVYSQSLQMPVVKLQIISKRVANSSREFLPIPQFSTFLNRQPIPLWSFYTTKNHFSDNIFYYLVINAVNAKNYEKVKNQENHSWPLRIDYATGDMDSGITIIFYVNNSHFFDKQSNLDMDKILLKIITFDADPNDLTDTIGVPEVFQLMPCDDLSIAISLQKFKLINQAESPCRNDYPTDLKVLLPTAINPANLFNAMFAPDLPYDQRICEELCVVKYWLPICNCFVSYDIWRYVGGTENISLKYCSFESENEVGDCSRTDVYSLTPAKEFDRCECFGRCEGYQFAVTAYDKFRHRLGKKFVSKIHHIFVFFRQQILC